MWYVARKYYHILIVVHLQKFVVAQLLQLCNTACGSPWQERGRSAEEEGAGQGHDQGPPLNEQMHDRHRADAHGWRGRLRSGRA